MTGFPSAVATMVLVRDQGCCAYCGRHVSGLRGREWSIHHRKPRGMGGSGSPVVSSAANGVVLCGNGTMSCHGAVEKKREAAKLLGFLIPTNSIIDPVDVPIRHAIHGWVLLRNDGTFTQIDENKGEK